MNISLSLHNSGKIDKENLNSEKSYNKLEAYARSKLANVMFTKELAKRLKGTSVKTYSVHPGLVYTKVFQHMDSISFIFNKYIFDPIKYLFFKSPQMGAQTSIYCALEPDLRKESGKYYQ